MKKNDEYIKNTWKRTLIYILPISIILIMGFISNPVNRRSIITGILISISILYFVSKNTNKKLEKLFQNEISNPLLDYYEKILKGSKNLQDKDAWIIYFKALICIFYGEFDTAVEYTNKIDWSKKVPCIQSLDLIIKTLICYLKEKDYHGGIKFALEAKEKGNVDDNYPGANKSRFAYETYIEIGQVLTGYRKSEIISIFESKFNKSSFFEKALIAWCLSNIYEENNNTERAKLYRNFCKSKFPHCKVLQL